MTNIKQSLQKLYGENAELFDYQNHRYQKLKKAYIEKFGEAETLFYSAPGRTEIGGNHTDHNNGCVLAAAINLDSIAVAAESGNSYVTLYSEGYDNPFFVDLKNLSIVEKEKGTTTALLRGIAKGLQNYGYSISGFNAVISSDVFPGSGLSSSASIEILLGTIFNSLFNNDEVSPKELALVGQFAENEFFGKPCGLMDQMACAVGGVVSIDFADPQNPDVEQLTFDLNKEEYCLVVVNSGGNHADLTGDYAAIPAEMKLVARVLGRSTARDISRQDIIANIQKIRNETGDRAILRTLHFVEENIRAQLQKNALKNNNFANFLKLINESGISSFCFLQNVFSFKNVKDQSLALALELSSNFIKKIGEGACRIHGGGFAGTILAFLPKSQMNPYSTLMESVFGNKCVVVLNFRLYGGVCVSNL